MGCGAGVARPQPDSSTDPEEADVAETTAEDRCPEVNICASVGACGSNAKATDEGDEVAAKTSVDENGKKSQNSDGKGSRSLTAECSVPSRLSSASAILDSVVERNSGFVDRSRIIRNKKVIDVYDIDEGAEDNVLGTGVSGAVRVMTHKVSGRRCALKKLSTQNMSNKKFESLYNEVDVFLKLDHPGICKLLEVYEDDSAVSLVMELCAGKELYERLADRKRFTEGDCKRLVNEMLGALQYLHSQSICHRDIKLENWVYADDTEDARLKLIDFGFSKVFNSGVPMTAMHGTIYYVAPEVLEGFYDCKCDVWSIGVIVYMLLSGSPPFNGDQDAEIIRKIKRGRIQYPEERWGKISDDAKEFIKKLLKRDPDERPSAAEASKLPWLQKDHPEMETISLDVLKSMTQFASQSVMRRAACFLIAFTCNGDELTELDAEFRKLDADGTGTIHVRELTRVLQGQLNLSEEKAKALFETIDQKGSQDISYTEFIAASLRTKLLNQETLLREAFQKFDVDNSGYITVDNLRAVLGDEYNGTSVEDIIEQVDIKRNGVVDYDEFVAALMDLGSRAEDPDELKEAQPSIDIVKRLSGTIQAQELRNNLNVADCLAMGNDDD